MTAVTAGTYTRIDLAEEASGVRRRMWRAGWREEQPADDETLLADRRLFDLLVQAEDRGWSVTQYDAGNARLLKGEPTRIDLYQFGPDVRVDYFPYGWQAHTRPIRQEMRTGTTIEQVLAELAPGAPWQVRRWLDGARAWKGALLPVRDEATIRRMRQSYGNRPQELARIGGGFGRIDFAFDL